MPRRKITDPIEKENRLNDQIQEVDQELALADYMGSLSPAGARFYIYRSVAGRHKYVATHDGQLTEEDILEQYGPGTYLIRPNVAGKWAGARRIDIEGRPHSAGPEMIVQGNGNDTMVQILQLQLAAAQEAANVAREEAKAAQSRQHEMIMGFLTRPPTGGTDPGALMGTILTGMQTMKQLNGGGESELDRITKIMELAEKFGGNGGGPKGMTDHLIDLAKDVLPLIMQARGANRIEEMPEANVPEPLPGPVNVPLPALGVPRTSADLPAPAPIPVPASRNELQDAIKKQWTYLERAADKNRVDGSGHDPESWAIMLFDNDDVGDPAAKVLIDSILSTKDFPEWLGKTGAIIENRKPWFEGLYVAVKNLANEFLESENVEFKEPRLEPETKPNEKLGKDWQP